MTATTSAPDRIGGTRYKADRPMPPAEVRALEDYLKDNFDLDDDLATAATILIVGTEVNHLTFRIAGRWLRIDWRTSAGERIVEIFG
jgi:hypothetical protein